MNPTAKARLLTTVKLTVTLALLAFSLSLIKFDTLKECLRRADYGLLGVSALIVIAGGFAGAASWFCVLRARLAGIGYVDVAACHWSGMFFNSFLPSNVGGDVVKGYIVARDQGRAGFVVASLLVDRVINLCLLLCIGSFTLLLHLGKPLLAGAFLMLLGLLLLAVLLSARRLLALVRGRAWAGAGAKLASLLEPVFELAASPRLLAPTLLAAFASQFLKTLHNVFVIFALGLQIPASCVWYVIPLFGVVSALPVTVGGLGLREMVAQGIAGPLHIDNTHLVTLSLAGHLMVVLVNMLGAIPFLLRRTSRGSSGKEAQS